MRLFPHVADGIHVLPVLHERLESADLVRAAFEACRPDAVVVEIPSSLESTWVRGVGRSPAVSVLLYETAAADTIYLPIHPADPMVEAARRAGELGLPLACGDLDVDGYADYRDAVPDPYTLTRLGPAAVYRAFANTRRSPDPQDARRESSMAFHARRLRAEGAGRVLLVCGMHHVPGIARRLDDEQGVPLTPPVRKNVRLVHLHPESLPEVLSEIPFHAAVYESRRKGVPPPPPEAEPAAAGRTHGPFRVLSGGKGDDPTRIADAVLRAAHRSGQGPLDRLRLQWLLIGEAEAALRAAAPDEKVERWQRTNLARYSRNLAHVSGLLVADLFDLLAAARGCVSDNFAWELHRLASGYPFQAEAAADLPTARIRAEELHDGVRRIRLFRRTRRRKQRGLENLLKRRRRDERWPGEWIQGFDGEAICSYPPEDVVIEEFGRYLRHKGKSVLSEENARSSPFTTSVLDGIDMRETIRHLSERTIWVRELGRAPGDVGSVVIILDEDRDPEAERFPYRLTWIGEHQQESDMAFYSTPPGEGVVGPGICRVTYGGFLLSYPPGRLIDVWTDPDYRLAETKAEVLLLAALDYGRERIVVHVGPRAPRSMLYQIAARLDRKILHIPLGTVSPTTLRKVRVMHILSGHHRREIAREFIW